MQHNSQILTITSAFGDDDDGNEQGPSARHRADPWSPCTATSAHLLERVSAEPCCALLLFSGDAIELVAFACAGALVRFFFEWVSLWGVRSELRQMAGPVQLLQHVGGDRASERHSAAISPIECRDFCQDEQAPREAQKPQRSMGNQWRRPPPPPW